MLEASLELSLNEPRRVTMARISALVEPILRDTENQPQRRRALEAALVGGVQAGLILIEQMSRGDAIRVLSGIFIRNPAEALPTLWGKDLSRNKGRKIGEAVLRGIMVPRFEIRDATADQLRAFGAGLVESAAAAADGNAGKQADNLVRLKDFIATLPRDGPPGSEDPLRSVLDNALNS